MRAASVRTLGELGDPASLEPIVSALDDASSLVRRHSIEALGRFADARLVPILMAVLDDEDPGGLLPVSVSDSRFA